MLPHDEWYDEQNWEHIRIVALSTFSLVASRLTETKSAWLGLHVYAHWNALTLVRHPGQCPAADRQNVSNSFISLSSSATLQQLFSAYSVHQFNASLDGASLSFDIAHTRPAAALPDPDETDPDEAAAAAAAADPDPESRSVVLAAAEEGARARQESTAMTEERPRMMIFLFYLFMSRRLLYFLLVRL
jgi:hypothetical protein